MEFDEVGWVWAGRDVRELAEIEDTGGDGIVAGAERVGRRGVLMVEDGEGAVQIQSGDAKVLAGALREKVGVVANVNDGGGFVCVGDVVFQGVEEGGMGGATVQRVVEFGESTCEEGAGMGSRCVGKGVGRDDELAVGEEVVR